MHIRPSIMKRVLWVMAFLVLVVIGGCNLTREAAVKNVQKQELKIATSFYPIYIMALNITKDVAGVKLINISQPDTGCLHDIQLSPADLLQLEDSDIFIINGLGMEGYLTKVIENFPNLHVIDSNHTRSQIAEDADHLSDENHVNPHTWVSIRLAIQQVKYIGKQLAELDPVNGDHYLRNTENYVAQLEKLKIKMHQGLETIENRDIITFHETFLYFAQEFDLHIRAIVQREGGAQSSAKELAETIEIVKQNNIKAIFIEPQYSDATAQTIARETNARVYTLDPGVTGLPELDAYIKAMEKNLRTLQEALKQ